MFKKRELKSIVFGETRTPDKTGKSVKLSVCDGDTVDLETKDGIKVMVIDTKVLEGNKFKGRIGEIDPPSIVYSSELKEGQEVEFMEENIISCSER